MNIVNTDNRIIANAVRIALEPTLEKWVSGMQQGFLKGRSMLSNVAEIEHAAALHSLQKDRAAMVLFDFAAAFPSINQEFLLKTLGRVGLPGGILNLVRALYHHNDCLISVAGARLPGFSLDCSGS